MTSPDLSCLSVLYHKKEKGLKKTLTLLFTYFAQKKQGSLPLHFNLYQPCSVLDSHLSIVLPIRSLASIPFDQFPYQIWVSRLRGLPVPPTPVSKIARLCGTFKVVISIVSLRKYDSRQESTCLDL